MPKLTPHVPFPFDSGAIPALSHLSLQHSEHYNTSGLCHLELDGLDGVLSVARRTIGGDPAPAHFGSRTMTTERGALWLPRLSQLPAGHRIRGIGEVGSWRYSVW